MAKKKQKEAKGCRLCKYRVNVPINSNDQTGPRKPSCCFGYTVNDEVRPTECAGLFTETDFYIKHPEEV